MRRTCDELLIAQHVAPDDERDLASEIAGEGELQLITSHQAAAPVHGPLAHAALSFNAQPDRSKQLLCVEPVVKATRGL